MTRVIELTQGKVVLVDAEDYEWLNKWKWCLANKRYAGRLSRVDGKRQLVLMHRLILNTPQGMMTDHIDGNGLNNQRSNLRVANRTQNQANRHVVGGTSSRFKGVYWHKSRNVWRAGIGINRRHITLGEYHLEAEAAHAYDQAAVQYFGAFAQTNFKTEPDVDQTPGS